MYPTKQRVLDSIGSTRGDSFRALLLNPTFTLLMEACKTQLLNNAPGSITGEQVLHSYFYDAGLNSVFEIVKDLAEEQATGYEPLEDLEIPEQSAQLLEDE